MSVTEDHPDRPAKVKVLWYNHDTRMNKVLVLMRMLALLLLVLLAACRTEAQPTGENEHPVPSPLFVDPNYQGSCDPEVVWNSHEQRWYVYYTARKATKENTWLGTPIGVISSADLVDWQFEEYCSFDGVGGRQDATSTFWAPAIIAHQGKLHMFVTWKPDTLPVLGPWGGPGKIVHYVALEDDPVAGWTKVADMHDSTLNTIDATVYRQGDLFHEWYKGKEKGARKNELYHVVSANLYDWENRGFSQSDVFNEAATGHDFEEAPYIFQWKERFWLITDPHEGLLVYDSPNGEDWKFQGTILKEPGTRPLDNSRGRHCSVAVIDDRAFIFYHVEPWREYGDRRIFDQPISNRRSVLQVAELLYDNGRVSCNRQEVVW